MTTGTRTYGCANCHGTFPVPQATSGASTVDCPLCGRQTRLVPLAGTVKANHEVRTVFHPLALLLFVGGFGSVCYFPWGSVGGVVAIFLGTRLARAVVCSACGKRLGKKDRSKECPGCGARLLT